MESVATEVTGGGGKERLRWGPTSVNPLYALIGNLDDPLHTLILSIVSITLFFLHHQEQ